MIKSMSFVLTLMLASSVGAQSPIASTFDLDAEGWLVKDLNCGNFNSVIGTHPVDWIATGGDPGAHIGRVDPSGSCYFFDAPAAFLGDRSAFIGRSSQFSLRTTVNDWAPGSVLVLIGNGGMVLVHDFAHPTAQWARFTVALEAASFTVSSAGGAAATPAQFAAVMADLEALRISAEYGNEAGEEYTSLDSVFFGTLPCPADLDGNGIVNGADLAIVLGSWGDAGEADLSGNGVVDGADIAIVLGNWGPCPA